MWIRLKEIVYILSILNTFSKKAESNNNSLSKVILECKKLINEKMNFNTITEPFVIEFLELVKKNIEERFCSNFCLSILMCSALIDPFVKNLVMEHIFGFTESELKIGMKE